MQRKTPCARKETEKEAAGVTLLVKLQVDTSQIPAYVIKQTVGADGVSYYKLSYQIQVTHYSAYTKYELVHENVNYGSVTAEYV